MSENMTEKGRSKAFKMPKMAIGMMIAALVQALLCLSGLFDSNAEQLFLIATGVVAVVAALLTAFIWDAVAGWRAAVRGALIAVPSLFFLFGVGYAVYVTLLQPEGELLLPASRNGDLWYNLTSCLSVTLLPALIVQIFFMPTLVAAASFGAPFDRRHLQIQSGISLLTLAAMTFYFSPAVYFPLWNTQDYAAPSWYIPNILVPDGASDLSLVQVVIVVFALVFTALTFVPAIGKASAPKV